MQAKGNRAFIFFIAMFCLGIYRAISDWTVEPLYAAPLIAVVVLVLFWPWV